MVKMVWRSGFRVLVEVFILSGLGGEVRGADLDIVVLGDAAFFVVLDFRDVRRLPALEPLGADVPGLGCDKLAPESRVPSKERADIGTVASPSFTVCAAP